VKELILHGGLGTRLEPLAPEIPKGFIPVRNRSAVERILDQSRGIESTIIVPKGDKKISALIEKKNLSMNTQEALDYPMQIIVETLDKKDEPLIVWWGDTLASIDVVAMALHHESASTEATMALWETTLLRELKHWGTVTLDAEGLTIDHPVPDVSSKGLIKAGVFVFNPAISRVIKQIATENWDMSKILNTLLYAQHFTGFVYQGYRVNLNYGYDLIRAAAMIGEFEQGPSQVVHASARLEGRNELGGNVSIDERVRIAEGVHISNSIVLEGSVILEGATIVNSVVGPGATVSQDSFVSRKMIVREAAVDLTESPY